MKNLLLIPIAFAMCACQKPGYNITGQIDGLVNDTVVVWVLPLAEYASVSNDSEIRKDTLRLCDGRLRTHIETTSPTYFMLLPQQLTDGHGHASPSSCTHFILDKGERIRIEGTAEDGWVRTSVKGSELNRDLSDFFNTWNSAGAELGEIQTKLESDTVAASDTLLMASFRTCRDKLRAITETYIAANLDREASGFILTKGGGAIVENYFHQLTPKVRNSVFKPLLDKMEWRLQAEQLRKSAQERIKVGVEAPDFTLKDVNSNDFTLSSLRGRYVVLDFWGSWCGWCIKGFPELKECYATHNGKFDVVGIACNDTPKKWLDAVKEYELPWINVINPRNTAPTDDIAVRYGISGYPTKIVVDPDGRIAEIFVGERSGFPEMMSKLLK